MHLQVDITRQAFRRQQSIGATTVGAGVMAWHRHDPISTVHGVTFDAVTRSAGAVAPSKSTGQEKRRAEIGVTRQAKKWIPNCGRPGTLWFVKDFHP